MKSPYYPPADRTSQWFSAGHATRSSNRGIVWHTTEMGVPGEPWPAYIYNGQRGGSAPHFTVKPDRANKKLLWRQHWRADESAKALAHPPGTPETNNSGVLQVELGGTSVKGDPGYYWPEADDWALQGLADFSAWAHAEWGIPLTDQTRKWVPVIRNSHGNVVQVGTPSRLSWTAWDRAVGHFGHQHVPGNDHVDPGSFPCDHMLALAQAGGDDMPTPDEIAAAVWNAPISRDWDGKPSPASAVLSSTQRYSLESGFVGERPPGNGAPGTDTTAQDVAQALTLIQAQLHALASAVAALSVPPKV